MFKFLSCCGGDSDKNKEINYDKLHRKPIQRDNFKRGAKINSSMDQSFQQFGKASLEHQKMQTSMRSTNHHYGTVNSSRAHNMSMNDSKVSAFARTGNDDKFRSGHWGQNAILRGEDDGEIPDEGETSSIGLGQSILYRDSITSNITHRLGDLNKSSLYATHQPQDKIIVEPQSAVTVSELDAPQRKDSEVLPGKKSKKSKKSKKKGNKKKKKSHKNKDIDLDMSPSPSPEKKLKSKKQTVESIVDLPRAPVPKSKTWHQDTLPQILFLQHLWRCHHRKTSKPSRKKSKQPLVIPSSYFSSTAYHTLSLLKAAHYGWKVRKIIESDKVKTLRNQHRDLDLYYQDQIKAQPTNQQIKAKAKQELAKSKEAYIGFISRVAESDKGWFLNVNNGESLAAKRDRVKKMREKAMRMKQLQNESMTMKATDFGSDIKKVQNTYEFDSKYAPVRKQKTIPQHTINDSYESYTPREGTGDTGGGGMGMTFDFSSKPKKSKAGKKGKKSKKQHWRDISPIQDTPEKQEEETTPQKKFLRRGTRHNYNPMDAIKKAEMEREQRQREYEEYQRQKEIQQQMMLDNPLLRHQISGNLNMTQSSRRSEFLDDSVQYSQNPGVKNQERKKRLSVKDIVNRPVKKIEKQKSDVKDTFQDMSYLKKVPKKVDCWLSKDSLNMSAVNRTNESMNMSNDQSMTGKGRVQRRHTAIGASQSPSKIPTIGQKRGAAQGRKTIVTQDQNSLYLSQQQINTQQSQESLEIHKVNMIDPRQVIQGADSTFSNDEENLEYLLEMLEESKSINGEDRSGILMDSSRLFGQFGQLPESEALTRINNLMNVIQQKMQSEENPSMKRNLDFEFEKLLIQLKEEYHSMFENMIHKKMLNQAEDNSQDRDSILLGSVSPRTNNDSFQFKGQPAPNSLQQKFQALQSMGSQIPGATAMNSGRGSKMISSRTTPLDIVVDNQEESYSSRERQKISPNKQRRTAKERKKKSRGAKKTEVRL